MIPRLTNFTILIIIAIFAGWVCRPNIFRKYFNACIWRFYGFTANFGFKFEPSIECLTFIEEIQSEPVDSLEIERICVMYDKLEHLNAQLDDVFNLVRRKANPFFADTTNCSYFKESYTQVVVIIDEAESVYEEILDILNNKNWSSRLLLRQLKINSTGIIARCNHYKTRMGVFCR